jgi:hypothetical protein
MPTDIIYIGQSMAQLLEDVPATIEFDEEAIVSGTLNYRVHWDNAVGLVAGFKNHPDFPFMTRKSATITRGEALWATVSIKFEGVSEETTKYAARGSTSTEPIETHPEFSTFAGKWYDASTWSNGAEFIKKGQKDQGKFLGFRLKEPEGSGGGSDSSDANKKAGVKSYLEGGMMFRETRTVKEDSNGNRQSAGMEALGYIDEPPEVSTFVDVPSGRDWLLVTCNIEQVGEGLKITKEWRLSGRNGWDADIYAPSV